MGLVVPRVVDVLGWGKSEPGSVPLVISQYQFEGDTGRDPATHITQPPRLQQNQSSTSGVANSSGPTCASARATTRAVRRTTRTSPGSRWS
ncbi:hypothetical protein [Amycolatopsis sp. FDAARGOS 1241]|uniref:hypothetical protein n=1 Tax=Amycolatopsis sp. FDAARGOS 1241 TaxID=2778070 RepID=UPI001951DEEA|nr:hypothetical protein [Amycolatopsis sp. FDAARGOS 1241]QRP45645.1 hypothetical protein I6J71_42165 [Amycolatopsis sp. FDAARGOS 1241]